MSRVQFVQERSLQLKFEVIDHTNCVKCLRGDFRSHSSIAKKSKSLGPLPFMALAALS